VTRSARILIAGVIFILAGNAAVLISVAYNRSGQPDAVVELSERELVRPYILSAREDSGLTLHLLWREPGQAEGSPRLTQDQLKALGFDPGADPHDPAAARRLSKALPRSGYVVLEFNGPSYQTALHDSEAALDKAKAELAAKPDDKMLQIALSAARNRRDQEHDKSSRLFAIDVGPDPGTLRIRYPDRGRYLILPCEVRLTDLRSPYSGYITGVGGTSVNVPLDLRPAIVGDGGAAPAHYTVRLAFGKHAEPWIVQARAE
jgi:hypothetical protein